MKTVKLTDKEIALISWELEQGILGDGSPYDKRLTRLIQKLKEVK